MKKCMALLLVLMVALCAFAIAEEVDYTAVPEGMTIGFINYTDSQEDAKTRHQGIEDWAKEHGVEVLYTEASGDAAKMMSACDTYILQGVDVIVDTNWNPGGGSALVQKCNAAGIPLISIDTYYEGENSYFVGVDNEGVGRMGGEAAAKYAMKRFDGKVDYLIVTYAAALESINARTTFALEGLRQAGIEIADENYFELETGVGDCTQLARQQMTDWLTAHPDGNTVIVSGNTSNTLGLQAAIEAQNRADDCIIISHGFDTPAHQAIENGSKLWVAAIDYMNYYYGKDVMELAVRLANGEKIDQTHFYVQTRYVDGDNYAEVVGE